MSQKSDLPFGSEFSPSQITDLAELLEMANTHAGDVQAFEAAVHDRYFADHKTTEYNRHKLANNTRLSLNAYGILERDASFTSFGRKLFELREDQEVLHLVLARHILLNLNGAALVQCVDDMVAAGVTVDLIQLRRWLEERGIHFPRGGKHASIMRLWLEKAGVFVKKWRIDQERLKEVMGVGVDSLDVLGGLSQGQRAYLRTLANMGGSGPHLSNDVERLATVTYGVRYNEKNLPKQVLYPLRDAGYITLERGTAPGGRGAKPFQVTSTDKLVSEVITPILDQLERLTTTDIRALLRKPMTDVLADLKAPDKHLRGLALEALAFKLMRLVDLDYVATRLRGVATGGAEVDVVFESARLVFSRWQVQCKNVARGVALDDVAKEVGLTHTLKSNVIVMVSTGPIGAEARKYANQVMTDSNLCIVMVDKTDVGAIAVRPSAIADVFEREARNAMKIKALDI